MVDECNVTRENNETTSSIDQSKIKPSIFEIGKGASNECECVPDHESGGGE